LLRIRLTRVGKKKQPSYRIIVADSRSPRDGAFLEIIGHYNPLTEPATLVVKEEQAVHWLKQGARPSETAAKLLTRVGVMEKAGLDPVVYKGKDVPRKAKEEKKAEEAAPAAEAAAEAPAAAAAAPAAEAAEAAEAAAEQPAAEEPEAEAEAEEVEATPEPEAEKAEGEPEEQPKATE
jgi:small subunit ribosomal protein S16